MGHDRGTGPAVTVAVLESVSSGDFLVMLVIVLAIIALLMIITKR